jgi:hypothetical protein
VCKGWQHCSDYRDKTRAVSETTQKRQIKIKQQFLMEMSCEYQESNEVKRKRRKEERKKEGRKEKDKVEGKKGIKC